MRIADVCVTTTEEQRRTEWMVTESLADFLDPNDRSKTVEGYPAPQRAVLIARKTVMDCRMIVTYSTVSPK
ncbi:tRNA (5-methoxyuridine) 34 synthase [Salmonella enterica subsp. enterica]|uniref:tRNA (5-methoxyuridine) 34 synthase n=1 Tax=Salmonella enterica I TaxID=59201 RepID=A0A3S4IJW5_SALET|nr:tRNA (5-methoxyuridine) 34 synthase [Salmonella enterica subsp. enterica]